MPKIGTLKPQSDRFCPRCNSERKISKAWTEKIKSEYGVMVLYHTQIICTNKECQKEFDKEILIEAQKREKIKQAKSNSISRKTS